MEKPLLSKHQTWRKTVLVFPKEYSILVVEISYNIMIPLHFVSQNVTNQFSMGMNFFYL